MSPHRPEDLAHNLDPCRVHREKPKNNACPDVEWTALLCTPADCTPPLLELHMQLCRLQHANEHENETTPSEDHLHKPPKRLCWESGELIARAVSRIPECTSSSVGPTLVLAALSGRVSGPRRVAVTCCGPICEMAEIFVVCTAQLP